MNIKYFACLSCLLIKPERGFKKLDNQHSDDKKLILNLISNFENNLAVSRAAGHKSIMYQLFAWFKDN